MVNLNPINVAREPQRELPDGSVQGTDSLGPVILKQLDTKAPFIKRSVWQ